MTARFIMISSAGRNHLRRRLCCPIFAHLDMDVVANAGSLLASTTALLATYAIYLYIIQFIRVPCALLYVTHNITMRHLGLSFGLTTIASRTVANIIASWVRCYPTPQYMITPRRALISISTFIYSDRRDRRPLRSNRPRCKHSYTS